MKIYSFILVIICYSTCGHCQKNLSKSTFKKIETTELLHRKSSNGAMVVSIKEKNINKYNEKGKIIKNLRTTYYLGKPYESSKTFYYYYETDKLTYSITEINDRSMIYRTDYIYNNELLKKKQFEYTNNDLTYSFSETYSYIKNSKIDKSVYEYIVKRNHDLEIKTYLKGVFKYDRNECVIGADWTASDSTYMYNKYSYYRNKRGLIRKEKEYSKNNQLLKISKIKLTYDDKGNWITKQTYNKRVLTSSMYREIEYY